MTTTSNKTVGEKIETLARVTGEAVKVNGRQVLLEVSYCIPNVESDSNTFSEVIGGRCDLTKSQAIAAVVETAKAWANGKRAEGHEISVWDEAGNYY